MNENGFHHTAFIFKRESMLDTFESLIDSQIPSNTLITLLQKALLFNRLEKTIKKAKTDPEHPLHNSINEIEEMFADENAQIFSSPHASYFQSEVNLDSTNSIILQGHKKQVYTCSWSPNSSILVTGSEDGTIIIWYLINGEFSRKQVIQPSNFNPEECSISSIDWSSNGKLFAVGCSDSLVRIYTGIGALVGELREHTNAVFNVKFNPEGTFLVSWSNNITAVLWNVSTLMVEHVFNHSASILDVAWRDNSTFAIASGDMTIGICLVSGSHTRLDGHTDHVRVVAWNCDSLLLASGSEDNTIRIWDTPYFNTRTVIQHRSGITGLVWSPVDPNLIISSSHDGTIQMCDAITGELVRSIYHHIGKVISLSLSPNGKFLASGGSSSGLIVVSDVETGQQVAAFQGSSSLLDIKWDRSGRYIAICFNDSNVAIIPVMSYIQ